MTTQERQIWDRQPDESSWDFARFCRYRDQGPARSIPSTVRAWLGEGRVVRIQQKRYRDLLAAGGDTEDYVKRVTRWWWRLCSKWNWVERTKAFDETVQSEAQQQAILKHIEEEAEQLHLRIVAARTLRAAGFAVWQRFEALVGEGKLDEMMIEEIRHVVTMQGTPATAQEEERPASRAYRKVPSIIGLLAVAREAITHGLMVERLELGEATERHETLVGEQTLRRLAEIVAERVPADEQESVAAQVDALLRGERGGGDSNRS